MKKTILPALVLLAGLCASARAESDAVLVQAKGGVFVRSRGEKKFEPAAAGAPLLFGDEVKTLKSASAHVVFSAGDAVLVKENSQFTLSGGAKDVTLSFKVGEFLIGLSRKLAPGESFRVRTPAAVAAVRGTLFWGLSDAKKDSTYASFASPLAITAQGRTVVITPGQKVKIPFGKAPETAEASGIPLTYLDTFAVSGSLEGMAELVAPELKPAPAPAPKKQESGNPFHDVNQ